MAGITPIRKCESRGLSPLRIEAIRSSLMVHTPLQRSHLLFFTSLDALLQKRTCSMDHAPPALRPLPVGIPFPARPSPPGGGWRRSGIMPCPGLRDPSWGLWACPDASPRAFGRPAWPPPHSGPFRPSWAQPRVCAFPASGSSRAGAAPAGGGGPSPPFCPVAHRRGHTLSLIHI